MSVKMKRKEAGEKMSDYAVYPQRVARVLQGVDGTGDHVRYSQAVVFDFPIDICAGPGFEPFYAPCRMKCVKIYGQVVGVRGAANSAWFTSMQPVCFADGTCDYLTVAFTHMNNADFGPNGIRLNRIYEKYEQVGHQGVSGKGMAPHLHVSAGKGELLGSGWVCNDRNCWVLTTTGGPVLPTDVFYIDLRFTTRTEQTQGLDFRRLPGPDLLCPGTVAYIGTDCSVYEEPDDEQAMGRSLAGAVKIRECAPDCLHPYRICARCPADPKAQEYLIGWVDASALRLCAPSFFENQILKYRGGALYDSPNGDEAHYEAWGAVQVMQHQPGLHPYLVAPYGASQDAVPMGWCDSWNLETYTVSDVAACADKLCQPQAEPGQPQARLFDFDADGTISSQDLSVLSNIAAHSLPICGG